jgi:hypothetical protein
MKEISVKIELLILKNQYSSLEMELNRCVIKRGQLRETQFFFEKEKQTKRFS